MEIAQRIASATRQSNAKLSRFVTFLQYLLLFNVFALVIAIAYTELLPLAVKTLDEKRSAEEETKSNEPPKTAED